MTTSPLAEYHVSQGATLAEYHGVMVPARFTDPAAENRAVRIASGLFDFSFRGKFRMKGRDHAKLLQRLVSNDVKKLTPGQGTYATLLNAQGHIVVDLRLYCAEDCFLVDTEADLRDKAIQSFRRFIIADQVEIEPLDLYAVAFQGPRARGLLEKTLHIDLPAMNEFDHFASNYAGFPIRVVRASSTGEEGYEVWVNAAGMEAVWGAACGQAPTYDMLPCGSEALESLRIEAGIPRYGQELGEDVIPLEAGPFERAQLQQGLLHRAGNCGARPQPRPRELEIDRFDRECRGSRLRPARRRSWREGKWRKSPAPAYRPPLAKHRSRLRTPRVHRTWRQTCLCIRHFRGSCGFAVRHPHGEIT